MFSFLRRRGAPEIDVVELDALMAQHAVVIIDVREEWEFKNGHVRGAINIPTKKLPDRVARLKRDKRHVVICQSGNRSRGAVNFLLDEGFEGAVSVRGGTSAWERSGRAIVR